MKRRAKLGTLSCVLLMVACTAPATTACVAWRFASHSRMDDSAE